jgi:hypothetical protein
MVTMILGYLLIKKQRVSSKEFFNNSVARINNSLIKILISKVR